MSSSDLIRWGGLAAMGAGVLFIVYSLLGVAVGKEDEPSPLDILAILGYVLQVVGLLGFHALQGPTTGVSDERACTRPSARYCCSSFS